MVATKLCKTRGLGMPRPFKVEQAPSSGVCSHQLAKIPILSPNCWRNQLKDATRASPDRGVPAKRGFMRLNVPVRRCLVARQSVRGRDSILPSQNNLRETQDLGYEDPAELFSALWNMPGLSKLKSHKETPDTLVNSSDNQ